MVQCRASDLRKGQQACVLNPRLRVDAVGDWPAVAGDGRWLGVDLVGEQGEGPCEAGFGGGLEGDGDRGWGEGDGSGEAANDGCPGGGAVFVVVAQWTPTGFVDTIRSGTMVYEERTGSGTGSQEVHPGI